MSFYKIKEVAQIALNGAADTTEEIIDGGRKFYCSLHQNHPAWTVARTFSDRSIILRAIDRMCDDGNYVPPPLPEAPFTGGQCPKNYYLRLCVECDQYQITSTSNPGNFQNKLYASLDTQGQFIVTGPIESVSFSVRGDCPKISGGPVVCTFGRQEVWATVVGANGTFERRMNLRVEGCFGATNRELGGSSYVLADSLNPLEIIPRTTDGSADDCGSLPPQYPDEPDPTDPELTGSVSITNIDNETNTYNVTVNRDVNNTINFPPTIVVNDVAITIDITGIDVLDNNNTDKNSGNDDSGKAAEEPVPVDDTVPDVTQLDDVVVTDVTESEDEDETIEYVITEITTFPLGDKTIIQSDSNDNDYFAGYFNWTTSTPAGNCRHPSEPIRKRLQIFRKPDWATGYRVYTVNRARINVTKFTQPAEE